MNISSMQCGGYKWITDTPFTREIPDFVFCPCQPWMGLKLAVFGILPTAKTHAKQMPPRSLHAMQHVYLHAQTALDASDKRTWWTTVILITGKTWRPQFESHAGIKMVQALEYPLYIWELDRLWQMLRQVQSSKRQFCYMLSEASELVPCSLLPHWNSMRFFATVSLYE